MDRVYYLSARCDRRCVFATLMAPGVPFVAFSQRRFFPFFSKSFCHKSKPFSFPCMAMVEVSHISISTIFVMVNIYGHKWVKSVRPNCIPWNSPKGVDKGVELQ